jgi:hypothetical protein
MRIAGPPWTPDELILALDLCLLDRRVPDNSAPEVVALSGLLNEPPVHAIRPDQVRFRNANEVALNLANFRARTTRTWDQPGWPT